MSAAAVHYDRALKQLSGEPGGIGPVDATALASCMLFVCIEMLYGNIHNATHLFSMALSMFSAFREARHMNRMGELVNSILPRFVRLDSFITELHRTSKSNITVAQSPLEPILTIPSRFSNLREISESLDVLLNSFHHDQRETDDWRDKHRRRYRSWYKASENKLNDVGDAQTAFQRQSLRMLQVRRLDTYLTLYGPSEEDPQTEWDKHNQIFEQLLDLYSAMFEESWMTLLCSIALDVSFIPPFMRVALRCREPSIRRAVISTLEALPPIEGLFVASAAVKILNIVVSIEEDGIDPVRSCKDVPDWRRISNLQYGFEDGSRVWLSYLKLPNPHAQYREQCSSYTNTESHISRTF